MKSRYLRILTAFSLLGGNAWASVVHYVDINSTNAVPPFTDWTTAATNIQDAVDAATAGDTVLVTNGVYATGGRPVGTNLLSNRVAVDKPLVVQSVNGPQVTVIQGYQVPGATNGDSAIRCVYLAGNASLTGFTLTNGATRSIGDDINEQSGGGILCASLSAIVSSNVVCGNAANWAGGGVYGGTLDNCLLSGNAAESGGAACSNTLNNCTLVGNWGVDVGGGANNATLNNCTVAGNSSANGGGGTVACALSNCTLSGNSLGIWGWVGQACSIF
jgi:hypothetical protein